MSMSARKGPRRRKVASKKSTDSPPELLAYAKPFHVTDPDGPNTFALIGFEDRDANACITVVPASYLVGKGNHLIEHLANRGYHWPKGQTPTEIIRALAEKLIPT